LVEATKDKIGKALSRLRFDSDECCSGQMFAQKLAKGGYCTRIALSGSVALKIDALLVLFCVQLGLVRVVAYQANAAVSSVGRDKES